MYIFIYKYQQRLPFINANYFLIWGCFLPLVLSTHMEKKKNDNQTATKILFQCKNTVKQKLKPKSY